MHSIQFKKSLALVLVVVAFTYATALQNDFVNFDDELILLENKPVKDFDIYTIFTKPLAEDFVPLTLLTFAIEYKFFGLKPFIYHLDNIILHLLNCILVFFLIIELSGEDTRMSFISSLLFGIHPLHVESVNWVAERKDVLSCFFYLLSLLVYLRYSKTKKVSFYWGAFIFGAMAILAKSFALTLPFVFLLIDYYQGVKIELKIIIEKIPLFIVSFLSILIAWPLLHVMSNTESAISIQNIIYVVPAFCFYISRSVLPVGLSVLYETGATRIGFLAYVITGLVIWGINEFVKTHQSRKNLIIFGLGFFLISGLPAFQFIRIKSLFSYADRYFYVPSVGLLLCYGVMLRDFSNKLFKPLLVLVSLFFVVLSVERVSIWRNTGTLWADVVSKYPTSSYAQRNLGTYLHKTGNMTEARVHLETALRLKPDIPDAHYNLGVIWMDQGDFDKALEEFDLATGYKPEFVEPLATSAFIYSKKGDLEKSIELYKKALIWDPQGGYLHLNLAIVYNMKGEKDLALNECLQAIKLESKLVKAHEMLGQIYKEFGRQADADQEFIVADNLVKEGRGIR